MGLESITISGCETTEQFVALFQRFCDVKRCAVATTRPVGSTLAFPRSLPDGTSMLRGMCLVTASSSIDVFDEMEARDVVDGTVEEVLLVDTNQHVPRDKAIDLILRSGVTTPVDATATVEMPPLFPEVPTDGDERLSMVVEPIADVREPIKTLLGVAPLTAAIVAPVTDPPTARVPSMSFRLRAVSVAMQPLLRVRHATTASMRPLHAMSARERLWFLAAFGAVVLLAALVLGSAVLSAR